MVTYEFKAFRSIESIVVMLFVFSFLLFPGCIVKDYQLLFPAIDGLKKGDFLIFEKNSIGKVTEVIYTEQGEYLVSIDVEKNFDAALTEFSRFEIVNSPLNDSSMAIVMTLEEKGGTPLERGVAVKAEKPASMVSLDRVTPLFKKIENSFDNFVNNLKGIPESESFRAVEDKIDELRQEMKNSGKEIQDNIRNNIIPKLEKQIEELKKKFKEKGEPEKVEPLEKKLKELQDV
ncbi:conserved hypothetical protein [Desulfamplus magnetovallimortis]|uniref:Mce/MlaD domain-containing protein n=1 Tax=Desulfamplus magnetovallimortis TaxID=1246637 RepID=A0A1W1HB50_9BACT|nr:hypothetical protein [Desulfamplus magnetovallimortis]SLM29724.1 conserved hypothetical protein [Desulfamplus magnetovallimortis]